ncbi:hypothetical protein BDR26DRAFT_860080 [Obelidium mucronatum]|nr:hypothetical protein BDR26DRAFT_860080 [Obelidium mucronatum]
MGGTSNVMGDATYECWISYEYQDLRIWLYYCWLWIHFVGIIAVYTQIFFKIQKTSRGINQLSTAWEGHVSNNLIDNPHHSSRALKSIKSFSGMEDSVMLASSTDGITNSSPLHSNPQIVSSPSYHKSVLLPSHQLRKGQESKRLLLENPWENSTIHRPNASMNGNSVAARKLSHSRMKLILKTSVIAFGFILSWTPATAKRIILLESPYSDIPEWLSVWMGVGLAFSGVWNAAAFFVGVLWDYWYL